jgi:DNA replication and repair protein RecF
MRSDDPKAQTDSSPIRTKRCYSSNRLESRGNFAYFLSKFSANEIEDVQITENLFQQFLEKEKDELFRRNSIVGPHRDDFAVYLNEKSVRQFGSQGQQRSVVLSLKWQRLNSWKARLGKTDYHFR